MYFVNHSRKLIHTSINCTMVNQKTSLMFFGTMINASLIVQEYYSEVLTDCQSGSNVVNLMTWTNFLCPPFVTFLTTLRNNTDFSKQTVKSMHPSTPVPMFRVISDELPITERTLLLTAKEKLKVIRHFFFQDMWCIQQLQKLLFKILLYFPQS